MNAVSNDLKINPKIFVAGEVGSAANGTTIQNSDIDLTIVGADALDFLF